DKAYWNRGYGTEALRLLLRHGFHTLNLNRVALRVYGNNARAIHAYEKAGFAHEGQLRQAIYKEGAYRDVLLMSVLREEWKDVSLGVSPLAAVAVPTTTPVRIVSAHVLVQDSETELEVEQA